ncbi:MAG: IS4 family transposase [Sphaerospermopsis sp. SIO1G2]|nr:IS4 family transposase [Sphaerospermopsis sp. SIO1G2]
MPNLQLFCHIKNLLTTLHEEDNAQLTTLSLMVMGLFFGRHVQLWMIALWCPREVQLLSVVRRFERFVADQTVDVFALFEPFVMAMQASLGNETAYLIIDCTQAGPKCRTLVVGLAYHGTILPLRWVTVKGKKGHLKGDAHRDLLQEVLPYFAHHRRVVVLGDAEFSNEPLISWLQQVNWDFVFRFQSRYHVQLTASSEWQSAQAVYEEKGGEAGQTDHWSLYRYTQAHGLKGLTLTVDWGKNEDEPIYLISSLPRNESPHCVYEMRFWIETLFGQQKSRGFALNRTRMTTPAHIDRLMLAVAIASCIALGVGTELFIIKQTKKVDRSDRRDLSLFQLGWRYLFRLLATNRLSACKMRFSWQFQLPPPGFQPA